MIFSSSSSSLMDQEEPTSRKPQHSSGGGGGGSSLEVAKRPRGRPLGSKNKPRPPTIITRELEPSSAAMRPHLLEIAPGRDIVASLSAFSTRRNLGVCVLAATGSVSSVALRRPEGTPLALRGSLEILSMSATFLTPGMGAARSPPTDPGAVTVSLAGPAGQVVGGSVVGPMVAAGTALVVAATFGSVEFHRLPDEDELEDVSASAGREESVRQQQQQQEEDREHEDFDATPAMDSRGMSADYSSHLPAESIWALAAVPRHCSS